MEMLPNELPSGPIPSPRTMIPWLIAVVIAVFTVTASATTYAGTEFGDVVRLSDLIVTGTVTISEPDRYPPVFQFRVDEVLSGTLPNGSVISVWREQLRSAFNRGPHAIGDQMALFLTSKEPRGDIAWTDTHYAVIGGDAEGELPILDSNVIIIRAPLLRSNTFQTTEVLFGGRRVSGYGVDSAAFAETIGNYHKLRSELIKELEIYHPRTAVEVAQAVERLAATDKWSRTLASSPTTAALFWAILGECEQALHVWSLRKKLPSWMADDVQNFLARQVQP